MVVHPNGATKATLNAPVKNSGDVVAEWIDAEESYWRCEYNATAKGKRNCAFVVNWLLSDHPSSACVAGDTAQNCENLKSVTGTDLQKMPDCLGVNQKSASPKDHETGYPCRMPVRSGPGIDLSGYDAMRVNIHYEGRARHLRLFMRNHNDAYSGGAALESGKFMEVFLRTEDLKAGPETIQLDEFNVAEWWMIKENVAREHIQPEFDNIIAIGIDHLDFGTHKMKVNRIEMIGERFSMEQLLTGVLIFWAALLLFEYWSRYRCMEKTSRERERQISELATSAVTLTMETSALHSQNLSDPLTGVLNRSGLGKKIKSIFENEDGSQVGVLLIDIDNFKSMNEKHGHSLGDQVLKLFVDLISRNIREDDIFARWGGNEFLVISPRASRSIVLGLGEKLRTVVTSHVFDLQPEIRITVSIGGTTATKNEEYIRIFKRIDSALMRAKKQRNTFVFE